MKFQVVGADRETGEDVKIVVEARDEVDAATIASRRNIMVSSVAFFRLAPLPKRNLKQCPKCKESIDKGATKCPHCRSTQPVSPWAYAIVALLVIGPALWCCGPCSIFDSTDTKQAAEQGPKDERQERLDNQFSAWDGSHRGLTKLIKAGMNDPGSYEHVESIYWDQGDHLVVRTTFRGKNAFGGVVKNWIKAKVDLDGNVISIIEQGP